MPPTRPEPSAPIAFLARQAGTAAAFAPLIDALEAAGEHVTVAALGDAAAPWAKRTSLLGDNFSDLEAALDQTPRPAVLVTGTSAKPEDDALSWRWARRAGVPSVAFVDSWVNYAERFMTTQGDWVAPLPDVITVIDAAAKGRLIEAGLPAERVRVVGSPAFDALVARRAPTPPRDDGVELLFASQPLAGRGFPSAWNEHHALDLVIRALETSALGVPITLFLRRHPAESAEVFAGRLDRPRPGPVTLRVDARPDRIEAVNSAHAVLGIVSMLLVESQWLGRPALSVQPGGLAPSDLLSLHEVPIVHDATTLNAALRSRLTETWSPAAAPTPALPRWRRLLEEMRMGPGTE